jgi:hypothetical protein
MTIPTPVLNTFDRVGINYQYYQDRTDKVTVYNRFGGGSCETSPLVAYLIDWVYRTNNDYDLGRPSKVKYGDFDRVRYFVLDQDSNAYYTCLD